MRTVVISQPMFLPWVGLFEQMQMADVFVHFDDVQFPQGRSFVSRVQVKTRDGIRWLSVPIARDGNSPRISDVCISEDGGWRRKHLETLRHNYGRAANFPAMFELAQELLLVPQSSLSEFNILSLERIAACLGLECTFVRASALGRGGRSSERLISICAELGAETYVTGHGARNYLDHEKFEEAGMTVRYMDYAVEPWPQLHGEFTPFVTVLDLMAAVPFSEARGHFRSEAVDWRTFLKRSP